MFEQRVFKSDAYELIIILMNFKLLKNEYSCPSCITACKLVRYKKNIDSYAWRCMKTSCLKYKIYFSCRKNSFFEKFKIPMKTILRILIKYSCRQPRYSIKDSLDVAHGTVDKVINELIKQIPILDFSSDKLGGPGCIVQVDETMLNYKCKNHRGRSPQNDTDALCIVEFKENITRAFATVIPDKSQATLVPIICRQVAQNSKIWTDEHKSYKCLKYYNFIHESVCHKYEFINQITGVNTQAVESFNNSLKLEIKRRKGVETNLREVFLKEFCFFFNNRGNLLEKIFNMIKV